MNDGSFISDYKCCDVEIVTFSKLGQEISLLPEGPVRSN
jgi:hypothetical protein